MLNPAPPFDILHVLPTMVRVVGNIECHGDNWVRLELDQADLPTLSGEPLKLPLKLEIADVAFLNATGQPGGWPGRGCRVIGWLDPRTFIVSRASVLRKHPSEGPYLQRLNTDETRPWHFAPAEPPSPECL